MGVFNARAVHFVYIAGSKLNVKVSRRYIVGRWHLDINIAINFSFNCICYLIMKSNINGKEIAIIKTYTS